MPPRDSTTVSDVTREKLTPKPPPHPILQDRFNFHGTVEDFNRRIETIDKAYAAAVGYRPTGGLVYDIARSPIKDEQVPVLFQVPRTRKAAASIGFVKANPAGVLETQDPLAQTISKAAELGIPTPEWGDLVDAFEMALKKGPKVINDFYRANSNALQPLIEAGDLPSELEAREQVWAALSGPDFYEGTNKTLAIVGRAGEQIAKGLAIGPAVIVITEAKAVYETGRQRSLKPFGAAQKELGTTLAKATADDVKAMATLDWGYMEQNPGNIIMTLLGLEGAAALGYRLVSRNSNLTRRTLSIEGTGGKRIEVEVINSENPGVALVQRLVTNRRQKKFDARHAGTDKDAIPADAVGALEGVRARGTLRKSVSFERKVGRGLEREQRLKQQLATMDAKNLERVTGWSEHVGPIQAKLPASARRGLTRGEQMALFIESLDEPGAWANRAAFLRDFHEQLIIREKGDPASHAQKLRDIQMAEKAMESPSPRFQKALELTRVGVNQFEQIKLQKHGLTAEAIEMRPAKAADVIRTGERFEDMSALAKEIERAEKQLEKTPGDAKLEAKLTALKDRALDAEQRLAGLERQREDSFYVKGEPVSKRKGFAKNVFRGVRVGPFGISPKSGRDLIPELRTEFTGDSLISGKYRVDTTRLTGEALTRTVRATFLVDEWSNLLNAGVERPRGVNYRAVRKKEFIAEELRTIEALTDGGEITAGEAGALSRQDWDALTKELFPALWDKKSERWVLTKSVDEVVWVPEEVLSMAATRAPLATQYLKRAQSAQNIVRTPGLYFKPTYALNFLGSAFMALMLEGVFAPKNFSRALFDKRFYGEKVSNYVSALVGSGRFASYIDEALTDKVTKRAAHAWNRITDRDWRASAFYHYAQRKGYKNQADLERLIDGAKAFAEGRTTDKSLFNDLDEIKERSNKAMVQFDNQTWFEQNVAKQVVYVYPWRRGQAVWSVRTLLERPITSDVLYQLGDDEIDDVENGLGRAGEWLNNRGFITLGFAKDGNPIVANSSPFNIFSGMRDLLPWTDGFAPERFGGPALEALVRAYTGKDEFGREYDGEGIERNIRGFLSVFSDLPQARALQERREETPLPPSDITKRGSQQTRLHAALGRSVLAPGFWGTTGKFLAGSFQPQEFRPLSAEARWYRDLTPEKRLEVNETFIRTALDAQAAFLGRRVPDQVRSTVELLNRRTRAEYEFEKANGDATPAEQTELHIAFFLKEGKITEEQAAEQRKEAKRNANKEEHEKQRNLLLADYGDTDDALKDWDWDVRYVAALADRKIVQRRVAELGSEKLLGNESRNLGKATDDDLRAYGLKALEWAHEVQRRDRELERIHDPSERAVARADTLAWLAENDKPVTVGGVQLPSPSRIDWARRPAAKRAVIVAGLAKESWAGLSAFEKELLGRKTDPVVARGYHQLEELKAEFVAAQPLGERRVPADFEKQAARYVNRKNEGFYKDWLYAQEPLGIRLQTMRPILNSSNRAEWQRLFVEVRPAIQAFKDGAPKSHLRDSWKEYVNTNLTFSPAFAAELELFGVDPAEDLF